MRSVVLWVLLLALPASAAQVQVQFSGVIDGRATAADPSLVRTLPQFGSSLLAFAEDPAIGESVSGTLILDTATANTGTDPALGFYPGAITAFSVNLGGVQLTYDRGIPPESTYVLISNSLADDPLGFDQVVLQVDLGNRFVGLTPADAFRVLVTLTSDLGPDVLDSTQLAVAGGRYSLSVDVRPYNDLTTWGVSASNVLLIVPEPGLCWLAAIALVALRERLRVSTHSR
jgi:hypothetical protein